MANSENPERAARMAKEAASVSHDGIAVDAAVYLESMAFAEKDIQVLLDKGLTYIHNPKFIQLVSSLRKQCEMASVWDLMNLNKVQIYGRQLLEI